MVRVDMRARRGDVCWVLSTTEETSLLRQNRLLLGNGRPVGVVCGYRRHGRSVGVGGHCVGCRAMRVVAPLRNQQSSYSTYLISHDGAFFFQVWPLSGPQAENNVQQLSTAE